jgi:hypothetical protein
MLIPVRIFILDCQHWYARSVLSFKNLLARFWSSGCWNGWFATRFSIVGEEGARLPNLGFTLLKALSLWGELAARAVEAQKRALMHVEENLIVNNRWYAKTAMTEEKPRKRIHI